MLNGRKCTEEMNGYTYYGPMGHSVVDYVIIPYDNLAMFSDFKVTPPRQVFENAGLVGVFDSTVPGMLCDHALLSCTWNLSPVLGHVMPQNGSVDDVTFTKYDVTDIPSSFMKSDDMIMRVNLVIQKLEAEQVNQENMDMLYDEFCAELQKEMDANLNKKTTKVVCLTNAEE